jgi:hypothetical protein
MKKNLTLKIKSICLALGLIGISHQVKSQCFDKHLNFNGSNQYVTVPNNIVGSLSGAYTIEFNLFWNGGNDWQRVFDFATATNSGQQEYLIFTPKAVGGKAQFAITTGSGGGAQKLESVAPLTANVWHHIAIVHTPSPSLGTKLFIDGTLNNQTTTITLQPIAIGATVQNYFGKSNFPDPYLNGKVDEFRISNIARYNANFSAPSSEFISDANTVALYHFNEAYNAQNIIDNSSSAFTAFLGSSISTIANDPIRRSCFPKRIYVDINAPITGLNNGSSWSNAYKNLQDALAYTYLYDTIWVADGIYRPDSGIGNRTRSFKLNSETQIYGGFSGTESNLSQRNWGINQTVLSGEIGSSTTKSDNTFNLVIIDNKVNVILDGFILQDAYSTLAEAKDGGGLLIINSNSSVRNCVIRNNVSQFGAGVQFLGGTSTPHKFENVIFLNDTAHIGGGAVANNSSNVKFTNCTFFANRCNGVLAYQGGAAVLSYYGTTDMKNCVIFGNYSFNLPLSRSSVYSEAGSAILVSYSCVEQSSIYLGANNNNLPPIFVNGSNPIGADNKWMTADDGLKLTNCSPYVNLGDINFLPIKDITGINRIFNGKPESGAYENNSISLFTARDTTFCKNLNTPTTINLNSLISNNINPIEWRSNSIYGTVVSNMVTVAGANSVFYGIDSASSGCLNRGHIEINNTSNVELLPLIICQGDTLLSSQGLVGTTVKTNFIGNTTGKPTYTRPNPFLQVGGSCTNSYDIVNFESYKFKASISGTYIFSTCGNASWDTFLALYQGTFNPSGGCLGNNAIAANDDACSYQSTLNVNLIAGQEYTLVVSAYSSSSFGAYTVSISNPVLYSGIINWYTLALGGAPIASTDLFNPIGLAGSGISNTNVPSTTTFYAETITSPACRVSVDFIIKPRPNSVISGGGLVCNGAALPNVSILNTGAAPYTFIYSNGSASTTVINTTINPYIISNAPIGNYTLTNMTDAACSALPSGISGNVNVAMKALKASTQNITLCNGQSISVGTNTYTNAGTYTNILIALDGCDSTVTTNLSINPSPVVSLGGLNQSTCLSNLSLNAGNIGASYVWNTGATSQTISTANSGFYKVVVTNGFGCVGSDSVNVTLNSVLTANISATATNVCAGSPIINLVGSPAGGNFSSNASGGVFNPTIDGTFAISYSVSNVCGSSSANTTITVNARPIVSITANAASLCQGQLLNLTGNGATNYNWDNGVVNGNNFVPTTSATYTLIGTDLNGCTDTASIVVPVNPNPILNLGGNQTSCASSILLDAANVGSLYNWNTGAVSQTLSVGVSGFYKVIVTNTFGCSVKDSTNITLIPTLSATLSPSTSFACNGGANVNFIALPVGGTFTPNASSGSYAPLIVGIDTIKYFASNSCGSDTAIAIITINASPIISTIVSPNDTVCAGTSVTLTASGANTYSWDNSVSNGVGFIPSATAVYNVTGTALNGCSSNASVKIEVQVCSGLNSNSVQQPSFIIFPNPNNGQFSISSNVEVDGTIELINELGQVVYKSELKGLSKNINVQNIAAGIYHLRIKSGTSSQMKRLSIIK